jgi:ketosteroid isomerase-like protein
MSELDDFLASFLPRQIAADSAIHDGDLTPRLAIWSRDDPVTLFGAFGPCRSGWDEVSRTFEWVASRFTGGTTFTFELVAAGLSGNLAYTVGRRRAGGAQHPARHPCLPARARRVADRPPPRRLPARGPERGSGRERLTGPNARAGPGSDDR